MVRYTLFEIFGKEVGKGWWPFFKKAPNWRHCRRLVSFTDRDFFDDRPLLRAICRTHMK